METIKAKELRVYVVNIEDLHINFNEVTDENWMEIAEVDGRVYSVQGFQKAFNNEEFNNDDLIRFIEV